MTHTPIATVELRSDGILWVKIREGAQQNMDEARAIVQACAKEAAGTKRPVIIDGRNTPPLDVETRHFYTGGPLFEQFAALALVLEATPMARLRANIYFRVAKPDIPFRLFHETDSAARWLSQVMAHV